MSHPIDKHQNWKVKNITVTMYQCAKYLQEFSHSPTGRSFLKRFEAKGSYPPDLIHIKDQ